MTHLTPEALEFGAPHLSEKTASSWLSEDSCDLGQVALLLWLQLWKGPDWVTCEGPALAGCGTQIPWPQTLDSGS